MHTLLHRNLLWSEDLEERLLDAVERCLHCIADAPPASNRTVLVAEMNCQFSDSVCVDHFWFKHTCPFHIVDLCPKYSAVQIVSTTSLSESVVLYEDLWVAHFLSPKEISGDLDLRFDVFVSFHSQYNIAFPYVPFRRHYKNLIETKHGIIGAIYLRL